MKHPIVFFIFALSLMLIFGCRKSTSTTSNVTPVDCSDVTSNITWPAGVYSVDCIINITNNATLTISPGTTIKFTGNGGFVTVNGGSISALGTSALPIVFTGLQEVPGFWYGIDLYSNSIYNQFKYCQFKFAGKGTRSMVRVGDGSSANIGRATFQNCTFANGLSNGLYYAGNSFLSGFINNGFSGNQRYPVSTELAGLDSLTGITNSFNGNVNDYIYVSDDYQVYSDVHFHSLNVPFYLNSTSNNKFEINSNWIVDAGTQVVMGSNMSLEFEGPAGGHPAGSFYCAGSSANPITIKGFQSSPGYWNKIRFMGTSSTNNVLAYTNVSDGGSNAESIYNTDPGMISVYSDGAYGANALNIHNCSISNSQHYGIFVTIGTGASVNGNTTTGSITSYLNGSGSGLSYSSNGDGNVSVH